jgi:3-hydroxyisobutyrate dehydrogenase
VDSTSSTEPGPVAFIGLGNMGGPMVARLAGGGVTVRAYDVAPAAREAVADLVEVTAGAAEAAPDALLVDMSSSEPARTRVVAERVRAAGARMIDAPVSGGVRGARGGTLTIMAGGDEADVEEARPVLELLGSRVLPAGPIGAGHAVKALNNLMSATHLLASCEALAAAERFGIEPARFLDIVNTSSGRSGSTERKLPDFVLTDAYDSGFTLALMLKDMRIAAGLEADCGTPDGLSRASVALWAEAAEALPPDADHTEIARWVGDRLGTGV